MSWFLEISELISWDDYIFFCQSSRSTTNQSILYKLNFLLDVLLLNTWGAWIQAKIHVISSLWLKILTGEFFFYLVPSLKWICIFYCLFCVKGLPFIQFIFKKLKSIALLFTSSSAFVFYRLFDDCSYCWEVILHCSFDMHFSKS